MQRRLPFPIALFLAVFLVSFANLPARATTVAPPDNLGHLARISAAVVFASALDSWVDDSGSLPTTITRFQLLQPVAGADPGFLFEVREPGGAGKERGAAVEGTPRFLADHNYLLFLDRAPLDRWQAKTMAYGLLVEDAAGDLLRPLAEASQIEMAARRSYEPVGTYRKDALLAHLRDVARGASWNSALAAAAELPGGAAVPATPVNAAFTAPQYCAFILHSDGDPVRWFGYETGGTTSTIMATTPGQTGIADGGVAAVQAGTASWTNHADSAIRYTYGGTRARNIACTGNSDSDTNGVVFNDPCGDIADLSSCVGTLAYGGPFFSLATQTYDGQPWHAASSTFVVVNNGSECVGAVGFQEMLAHELGHTQGFGHHNPPNPADAIMSAFLKNDGLGAALRSQDKICAEFAYHTFVDVPYSNAYWRYIEAIENAGVTAGCVAGSYCPSTAVTRSQMAIFLVRGIHGGSFVPPPASGQVFADVPASDPAAPFIEQLYRDGITNGCSPGLYCPALQVKRSDMAAFLERAKHGAGYVPPAATGTVFADVPAVYPQAAFIEQLFRDGVTTGCATNPNRYCPVDPVARDQMAAFLARTFALPLP